MRHQSRAFLCVWHVRALTVNSSSFNGSFINPRAIGLSQQEYGEAGIDHERGAVELLRKDVHRLAVAVQQLGDKIGESSVWHFCMFSRPQY
jgi:hypothetical protein